MLGKENRAVIIDMDSTCEKGETMDGRKRRYGWSNPGVNCATIDNYYEALQEAETWLFGAEDKLRLN
jgi:hypothetical protein